MALVNHLLPVIVVPDGLQADVLSKKALPYPSFVYRSVLDFVRQHYAVHPIYLAPANKFGANITEQEAAKNYLSSFGVKSIAPASKGDNYIDTRGNAQQLRCYLEAIGMWPLGSTILVVGSRHARRAALCFHKEGFELDRVVAVPYTIPTNEIPVIRLWYYRYPLVHIFYEILAWLRDACRLRSHKH